MTIHVEGKTPGDFLLYEADSRYSRRAVTITGGDYEPGTVMGQITADEKFTICKHDAADGSEVAVAVLIDPAKAASEDVTAVVLERHATVRRGGLTFDPVFASAAQRDAAVDQLKAVGIKAE